MYGKMTWKGIRTSGGSLQKSAGSRRLPIVGNASDFFLEVHRDYGLHILATPGYELFEDDR